jgi:hypothetical protein
MDIFQLRKPAAPTPEPTVQEARVQRQRELQSRLHGLDAEGKLLDAKYRTFRRQNMVVQDGCVAFVAPDCVSRSALEGQLHLFQKQAGVIDAERSTILQELARLSAEREFEESHA